MRHIVFFCIVAWLPLANDRSQIAARQVASGKQVAVGPINIRSLLRQEFSEYPKTLPQTFWRNSDQFRRLDMFIIDTHGSDSKPKIAVTLNPMVSGAVLDSVEISHVAPIVRSTNDPAVIGKSARLRFHFSFDNLKLGFDVSIRWQLNGEFELFSGRLIKFHE